MFLKPKSLYKCLFLLLTTVCTKLLWQFTWFQMPKASFFLGQWKIGKLWKSSSKFRNYKIRVRLSCGR